jgi:hypothetical protein
MKMNVTCIGTFPYLSRYRYLPYHLTRLVLLFCSESGPSTPMYGSGFRLLRPLVENTAPQFYKIFPLRLSVGMVPVYVHFQQEIK